MNTNEKTRFRAARVSLFALTAAGALAACTGRGIIDSDASDAAADIATDRGTDATAPNDVSDVQVTTDVMDATTGTDATDTVTPTDVVMGSDVTDASTDVAVDAVVADAGSDAGDAGCRFTQVIVGVSDYTSFGGYVVGNIDGTNMRYVPMQDAGPSPVDQDHGLRSTTTRCETYDLWHTNPAHIVTLDPANPVNALRTLTVPAVPSGGDGGTVSANPYDIAVVSATKAYVVQYNSANVLIVDPSSGAITGSISLAALADADGIPEAASITIAGGRAFIALQQLDRNAFYAAPTHSHIAVVDTATDQLVDADPSTTTVDAIELTHGNPAGDMPLADTGIHLLVTEIGNYGNPVSGIDVIDVTSLSITQTIESTLLGGKPSSAAWVSGTSAWATVDRGATHDIVSFEAISANPGITPIASSATYNYGSLRRAQNGTIWSIGGDYNAGSIHAFSSTGTAILSMPFTTGMLNTTSLEFLP